MKKEDTLLYKILANRCSPNEYLDTLNELDDLKKDIEINEDILNDMNKELDILRKKLEDKERHFERMKKNLNKHKNYTKQEKNILLYDILYKDKDTCQYLKLEEYIYDANNDFQDLLERKQCLQYAINKLKYSLKEIQEKIFSITNGFNYLNDINMETELDYIYCWISRYCYNNYYCSDIGTIDNFFDEYEEIN